MSAETHTPIVIQPLSAVIVGDVTDSPVPTDVEKEQ